MDEILTQKPYKTTLAHLGDLKGYLDKEIGLTQWMTITQERIDTFAKATEDYQWIHVNPEMSAQYSPYKTTVAHGFLVLSLASKFTYECYAVDDITMGVNYGLDKVRFPNATPVNAELRGRMSLMEYKEIPNGARYKLRVVFEIKGEEKPACVAEFIAQAYADPNKKTSLT